MPKKKKKVAVKSRGRELPQTLDVKKSKKKRKRSKVVPVFMVILAVVLVVLVVYLLVESGVVESPFENVHIQPQKFLIRDECARIVGNLMHTIDDEEGCEQKCKTDCGVREMSFHDSEFIGRVSDCHLCDCYCI